MIALQKQANGHDPDAGIWGDCHRTAVAMVLGVPRDDVPHVFDRGVGADVGNRAMRKWLAEKGLAEVTFPVAAPSVETLMAHWKVYAGGCPFILGGKSRTGCNHSVAVEDGVIFDPSIVDSGIVGACDDGYFWVTFFMLRQGQLS